MGLIALILAFFLLLISTTSNIKENVWELGVLRAMGLTQFQSTRVFMYEAFAVIFSSLLLGIFVGLIVSITLTAQFYLFIELPFKLSVSFRHLLTFVLVPNSVICNYDSDVSGYDISCCVDSCEGDSQEAHRYCSQGHRLSELYKSNSIII